MAWFISSLVSMIKPLKFFIKIISVRLFWIMMRKGKIYFMMCHRKWTTLLSLVIEKIYLLIIFSGDWTVMSCFLAVTNICCVTRIIFSNFRADDQSKKNRPALNLFFFFLFFGLIMFLNLRIGYLMLCFYSISVQLNVFRISSSWLSL